MEMPIYIDRITSEVTVLDGELPFTPAQIDRLVTLVLKRLDEKQREDKQGRDARTLRSSAATPLTIRE
jgi:hypothetical protein